MRYQFGDFAVDDGTRQLLRGGAEVRLSPKALDLLLVLARSSPDVVPKSALFARLWPDTHVTEASLAMAIAEVRAALGESAREPRFVRTVHRHGYALRGVTPIAPAVGEGGTRYWLSLASGRITLSPGDNLVGRDPKAQVWLDDPSVSRQHARIQVGAGGVVVEDIGSKNGTRVRGAGINAPVALGDGDEVRFGSVAATFKAGTGEPTRTATDSQCR